MSSQSGRSKSGNPAKKAVAQEAVENRREELRRSRRQQLAKEQSRKRLLIGGAILCVVALIVAITVIVMVKKSRSNDNQTTVSADQLVAPHSTTDKSGIWDSRNANNDAALHLVVYQDYQCPICSTAHNVLAPYLSELTQRGDVAVEYRTKYFLDDFPGMKIPQSSYRAAIGAACADVSGKYHEYSDYLFANQPKEGDGYTEEMLRVTAAEGAGLSGDALTKFQTCYDTRQTKDFIEAVDKYPAPEGFSGTPYYLVNGKPWSWGKAVADDQGYVRQDLNAETILESLKATANS